MCNKETTNVNRHTSKCELQNCNICKRYKHFVYKGFKDKQNMIDYMRKKSSVHVAGSCNYCPKCGKPLTDQVFKEQKTQTNADKIRSMTDEELCKSNGYGLPSRHSLQ